MNLSKYEMPENEIHVLNIAPLASRTGAYGGPFETSLSQCRLVVTDPFIVPTLFAPHLAGDAIDTPKDMGFQFVSPRTTQLTRRKSFHFTISGQTIAALVRKIRESDITHISFAREIFPILAVATSLFLRKKTILQPHGMLTARTSPIHKFIDFVFVKPIYKRSHIVVALTEAEKAELLTWYPKAGKPILVIGNPTQRGIVHNLTGGDFKRSGATFIARLHPRKRVIDFASAAKLLNPLFGGQAFKVAGPDQGDFAQLEPFIQSGFVTYLGALSADQVAEELAKSKVFVLCSEKEPWGNVLVKALSLGVPVVITESCALANVVRKYNAGHVVADFSPNLLSQALQNILGASSSEYSTYVRATEMLYREEFSEERIAEKLKGLYFFGD